MDSNNETVYDLLGQNEKEFLDHKVQHAISRIYKAYIMENSMPEIIQILLDEDVNMHYSIVADCTAILKVDMTLADILFFYSDKAIRVLDAALANICCEIYQSHALKLQMSLKPNLHARIKNIPVCPELWREHVPKSKDIGKFLAVEGTVIRTSSVKLLEYEKELICAKCQNTFILKAEFEQHYSIPTPSRCPVTHMCTSKKFIVSPGESATSGRKCKDFQEIKIQEQMRRLAMGTIPRTITVVLEDDLVDGCKAGDDVIIYGALKCRWQQLQKGKTCNIELVLKANYIEVRNEQRLGASVKEEMQNDFECFWAVHAENPMTARNHILASLCPQIYGLYVVKLAVALVLAGGVPRTDSSGSRVRGEAHLLLVGDPGTGKSQFLKYASKITPRSVLTTGIGSTSAGLTVTAIRDGPHWTLEAGALVLADGGICCIDEFSSIKENDRGAIHEAMEQQTVSVAKAGLVCKLNTRTSVLAATNPKLGKYDESSSIDLNVAIASPLLSRFDIVLVLLDGKNERWDSVVADYVLTGKDVTNNNQGRQRLWSMEQMQAYFCVVKQINPVLSPSANRILSEYYRCHRRSDTRNAARTTIRLLESLIRIAEAHARLMYRQTVEVLDAVAAITILESSMQGASLLPTGSVLHSCFPTNPENEYKKHAQLVLNRLGLNDILEEEMSDVKATNSRQSHNNTLLPPASPFEPKVFTDFPQKTSTSSSKVSTPRIYTSSKRSNKDFTFEDFEQSVCFENIFQDGANSSQDKLLNFKTSTQNTRFSGNMSHFAESFNCESSVLVPQASSTIQRQHQLPMSSITNSPQKRIIENHEEITHGCLQQDEPHKDICNENRNPKSPAASPTYSPVSCSDLGEEFQRNAIRDRLNCFRRQSPPSPEIDFPLSGMIRRGKRKHCPKSGNNSEKPNIIEKSVESKKCQVREMPSSSSNINFNFEEITDDMFLNEINGVSSKSTSHIIDKSNDTLPVLGGNKSSIFSLSASAVEDICDELAFNEKPSHTEFLQGLRESQHVIKQSQAINVVSTASNPTVKSVNAVKTGNCENGTKSNDLPNETSAASLFRIEDDFEDWGIDKENDFSDFNVDWTASQDMFSKKRKTFEL
uniref:DNA helicase MCM9-like isoform X1 n=1 Tax=Styela clava TaxID=7725 RepID=UPI001939E95D|nr:DNA helicase MCM9-like isoform X1 [Styela clava]